MKVKKMEGGICHFRMEMDPVSEIGYLVIHGFGPNDFFYPGIGNLPVNGMTAVIAPKVVISEQAEMQRGPPEKTRFPPPPSWGRVPRR